MRYHLKGPSKALGVGQAAQLRRGCRDLRLFIDARGLNSLENLSLVLTPRPPRMAPSSS